MVAGKEDSGPSPGRKVGRRPGGGDCTVNAGLRRVSAGGLLEEVRDFLGEFLVAYCKASHRAKRLTSSVLRI